MLSPCSALSQRVTASFFGTLAPIAWESTNQAMWTSGSRHGLHHLPRKASLLRSRDVYISPPPCGHSFSTFYRPQVLLSHCSPAAGFGGAPRCLLSGTPLEPNASASQELWAFRSLDWGGQSCDDLQDPRRVPACWRAPWRSRTAGALRLSRARATV